MYHRWNIRLSLQRSTRLYPVTSATSSKLSLAVIIIAVSLQRFAYLSSSVGVLIASVLFFFTTYCLDFFAAVSHSQQYLTEQTVAAADEFHFWLKCAVVMSIIVATLFTLAGLCVVLSFTPKREVHSRFNQSAVLTRHYRLN